MTTDTHVLQDEGVVIATLPTSSFARCAPGRPVAFEIDEFNCSTPTISPILGWRG